MAHAAAFELDSESPGSSGGGSFSGDTITLGTAGAADDWVAGKEIATNSRFAIARNSIDYFCIDPATTSRVRIMPGGEGAAALGFHNTDLGGTTVAGTVIWGTDGAQVNIGPNSSGAAGKRVHGIFYDQTQWGRAISWGHCAAVGGLQLKLAEDGGDAIVGGAAIATNATTGFLKITTCAGTPTGTPAAGAGTVVLDTTAVKFWAWSGAAWKGILLA